MFIYLQRMLDYVHIAIVVVTTDKIQRGYFYVDNSDGLSTTMCDCWRSYCTSYLLPTYVLPVSSIPVYEYGLGQSSPL